MIGNNTTILGTASISGTTNIGGGVNVTGAANIGTSASIGSSATIGGAVFLNGIIRNPIGQNANVLNIDPATKSVYFEPHSKYSAPLYSDISNNISISQSNSTTNGYLSSGDWVTFNNKQNALVDAATSQTYGYLTSVS